MTGSMHRNIAHSVLGVSNATPHTTELLCMQDRKMHAAMVRAQERLACERRGGREVCITS